MPSAFIKTQPFIASEAAQLHSPPPRAAAVPHFFSNLHADSLERALKLPYSVFIEIGERKTIEPVLELLMRHAPHFAVSLTTASAYRSNIAQLIADALRCRFGMHDHRLIQVETCLHEAVMNAVMHGNLMMRGDFKTVADFAAYYQRVEDLLQQVPFKDRRVGINAWNSSRQLKISVCDEGNGFVLSTKTTDSTLPNGRGLHFIRELADEIWVGDDRRTLYMNFSY